MIKAPGYIKEAGVDVFRLEVWKFFEDICCSQSCCQEFEHIRYPYPHSPYGRPAAANCRVGRNSEQQFFFFHNIIILPGAKLRKIMPGRNWHSVYHNPGNPAILIIPVQTARLAHPVYPVEPLVQQPSSSFAASFFTGLGTMAFLGLDTAGPTGSGAGLWAASRLSSNIFL